MMKVLGQVQRPRNQRADGVSPEAPRTSFTMLRAGENGYLSRGLPQLCLCCAEAFYNLMRPSVRMRLISFPGLSTQILTSSRNILTEIPPINICASCCPVKSTHNEPSQACILNPFESPILRPREWNQLS